jgi:hypothetical protein
MRKTINFTRNEVEDVRNEKTAVHLCSLDGYNTAGAG